MKIRTYRLAHNLTVNQLANAIGISQAALTRYENEDRRPEHEIMQRIFEVTGGEVTPNDFYLNNIPQSGGASHSEGAENTEGEAA